jgi:error-prone DNA polymerase
MGFYSPAVIAGDAKRHGVAILPVDVNRSVVNAQCEDADRRDVPEASIGEPPREQHSTDRPRDLSRTISVHRKCRVHDVRLGFTSVKSLGDAEAAAIVAERDRAGSFRDFDEFARRVGLKEEALRNLALVGAFDAFGETRRALLWRARDAHRTSPAFARPTLAFSGSAAPPLPLLSERERVALDYRITGIPTGPQIMRFYREELDRKGVLTTIDLDKHRNGELVRVAGAVVVKQHPETAKGHVFLSLEDETGMANIIIRPATYKRFKKVLDQSGAVVVSGPLQLVDGVTSVMAARLDGLELFVELKSREWH